MISANEALRRCAAYCSKAERCVQDVEKKLEQWELPVSDRQTILSRLQKEGFIEESRYCRSFVNDKSKFAKWGKNKIRYTLSAKGIAPETIDEALQAIDPELNENILMHLLQNKKKSVKGKDNYEIRMKLMRFAAGRGFDLDTINHCLNRLCL